MEKNKYKKKIDGVALSLDEWVAKGFEQNSDRAVDPRPEVVDKTAVIDHLMSEIKGGLFFDAPVSLRDAIDMPRPNDHICGVVSIMREVIVKKHSNPYHKYEAPVKEYVAKFIVINFVDPSGVWDDVNGVIDKDELLNIAELSRESKQFWDKFGAIYIMHYDVDCITKEIIRKLGDAE